MLRGVARRLEMVGRVAPVTWMSLSREPARLAWGPRKLDLVSLPPPAMGVYAEAKSSLWNELHGLRPYSPLGAIESGLDLLGKCFARRTAELHEEDPFDLVYTHDFQLLTTGRELPRVPKVFRWHGPMRRARRETRAFVARCLNEFDAVIVSTRSYANELRSWGVRAPIHASYPFLDEERRRVVTASDVAAFEARHGLDPDDVAFVVVARMDPIKCHDVAIRALARIALEAPRAKLVLVGGGGFSSGRQGLGLSQGSDHRSALEAQAMSLGVRDRVLFTGGVSDAELDVAITRARAVILPSAIEGFGLAAVEGWLYGKPALVCKGAGVAELVRDGVNGHVFEPSDDASLAHQMLALAEDEARARAMGQEGRRAARTCHLDRGADEVWSILRSTMDDGPAWKRSIRRRW